MRARIELTELEAIDSGERVAEPHLWAVFFKVDGSTFATVLAQKLERGRIHREELDHRGIGAVQRASADNSSFEVPGNKAGRLRPMSSGDTQSLELHWEAELRGDGILHPDDVAIGCFVVGWELDSERGGGSDAHYAKFAADVQRRVFVDVAQAIDSQRNGRGPFRFPIHAGAYLRQLDSFQRQLDKEPGVFAGQEHEVDLAKIYRGGFGGGVDPDDLLGPLVVAVNASTLSSGPAATKRLWMPTAQSEEGTWQLRLGARRA